MTVELVEEPKDQIEKLLEKLKKAERISKLLEREIRRYPAFHQNVILELDELKKDD